MPVIPVFRGWENFEEEAKLGDVMNLRPPCATQQDRQMRERERERERGGGEEEEEEEEEEETKWNQSKSKQTF